MKTDQSIVWQRVDVSSLDLKGMKAAVVGGTGGLGRAIARVLASRGAAVTVVGQTFRDAGVQGIEFIVMLREVAPRLGRNRPAAKLKPRAVVMGYPGTGQAG